MQGLLERIQAATPIFFLDFSCVISNQGQFTGGFVWIFHRAIFFRGVMYDALRTHGQEWMDHVAEAWNLMERFILHWIAGAHFTNMV